ncbi:MAG: AAA family ATPase [Pseudomonadales bacterium]|nr:AAA family ATPase [Pseudomonadales bacterium]
MNNQLSEFVDVNPYREIIEGIKNTLALEEGVIKLIGDRATGKTQLCRILAGELATLGHAVLLYAKPPASTEALQAYILKQLGIRAEGNFTRVLSDYLLIRRKSVSALVMIFDDAEQIDNETFMSIRMLGNIQDDARKLVRIVLCGTRELQHKLETSALRSLAQSLSQGFLLEAMNRKEFSDFCQGFLATRNMSRLIVDAEANASLHRLSEGRPGKATRLLQAMLDEQDVPSPIGKRFIRQMLSKYQHLPESPLVTSRGLRWQGTALIGAAGLFTAAFWLLNSEEEPVTAAVPRIIPPSADEVSVASLRMPASNPALVDAVDGEAEAERSDALSALTAPASINDTDTARVSDTASVSDATSVSDDTDTARVSDTASVSDATSVSDDTDTARVSGTAGVDDTTSISVGRDTDAAADESLNVVAGAVSSELVNEEGVAPSPDSATLVPEHEFAANGISENADSENAATEQGLALNGSAEPSAEAIQEPAGMALYDSLQNVIRQWSNSWQQQNLEAYFSYYHADFSPLYDDSVAAWHANRETRISRASAISISFDRFEIVRSGENEATVRFWMSYATSSYADETWKELQLRREAETWLILSERNLDVRVRGG